MFSPYCSRTMALLKMLLGPVVGKFVKISAEGLENIPRRGPFVLVSNHRSFMDPIVITAVLPRYVAWVADAFLLNAPLIGSLLHRIGVIPISQERRDQLRAFRQSREIFRAGHAVGIFPEGHDSIVTANHTKVGRFHAGFAELALTNAVPVLPLTVLPVEERAHILTIPRYLRQLLRLPADVTAEQISLTYSKVHIEIGKHIDISPYMTAEPIRHRTRNSGVSRLVMHTRLQIGETFRRSMVY